jgi:hypothetical protein
VIGAGSRLVLAGASGSALQVDRLEIEGGTAPSGTLDLQDHGLIVHYEAELSSPYERLRTQIMHARNEHFPAFWTGAGITSAIAASRWPEITVAVDEAKYISV